MTAITLDQARALDAVARLGSVQKAAAELHKVHSAVVYLLKSLEEQSGLGLIDRQQYRATLTPVGQRVLEECRKLLQSEAVLKQVCQSLKKGYEPILRLVFDGILPVQPLLRAVSEYQKQNPFSQVFLTSEYLRGVEAEFIQQKADLMLSVLPVERAGFRSVLLESFPSVLVAHRDHSLLAKQKTKTKIWSGSDLSQFPLLVVRGADPLLALPTGGIEGGQRFVLGDFHAKKIALLEGMGFGWMPRYWIEAELSRGILKPIQWEKSSEFHVQPQLVFAAGEVPPSLAKLIKGLQQQWKRWKKTV